MIGDWKVERLPRCTHHVFLSHCAEDRVRLVQPVYRELGSNHYLPWIDHHHYPRGQGSFAALREGIILCRHVVYFVTAPFLSQGRGWSSVELAYSNLLQENFYFRWELCHIHFPLFFVPQDKESLLRSAWAPLVERGRFYPPGRVDSGAVHWATQEIIAFIRQEEKRGASLVDQVKNDPSLQPFLEYERYLLKRITCEYPVRLLK